MAIPKYDELFNPVLAAMRLLGGSGRIDEIDDTVSEALKLSEKDANQIHKGNTTVLSYRAAWARNYLKRSGLLENSDRGVWALTPLGLNTDKVDTDVVKRRVKALDKKARLDAKENEVLDAALCWQEQLLDIVRGISPAAFERLCQRLLRESGFSEVTVEGRSGDGGIDGRGLYKQNGLISTRVIFQSKRYKGSVSSSQLREFKGTMSGRAEKGLFITTGTFTREARKEAVRDGSPPIDLVDGKDLAQLLKDSRLGVEVKVVEEVEITSSWFEAL